MDIFSYLLGKNSTSGGGGSSGFTYEEGTYEPTEDIVRPIIYFEKQHNDAPFFVAMYDVTGTQLADTKTTISYIYFDNYKMFGYGIPGQNPESNNFGYAFKGTTSRYTSTTSLSQEYNHFIHSIDEPLPQESALQPQYPKYWMTNTYFKAGYETTSRKWKSGRKYKWIAIFMD